MKTKTTLLAIFLSLTHLTLQAETTTPPTVQEAPAQTTEETLPQSKYVTEQNETNNPKKDNSRLYNFLLAITAVAVAVTAIILVSHNQGKPAPKNN
jgi:hypothetical protein